MQQEAQSELLLPKQLMEQLQEQLAMQLPLWPRADPSEQHNPVAWVQQHVVHWTVWAHAVLALLLWPHAGVMRPLLQSEQAGQVLRLSGAVTVFQLASVCAVVQQAQMLRWR